MLRWNETLELTRQRVLLLFREPEAVFWVFAFPIVLSAVLGFAFKSGGPKPVVVGLLENGAFEASAFEGDERLEIVTFDDADAASRALHIARVDLLLEGTAEAPRVRLDPSRDEAATARARVLLALSNLDEDTALPADEVTEPGSRYIDFLVPGLLGMSIMGTGVWAIGFAIADMRQRKLLKRLLVTPMRRSSLLASFMLSRIVFLVFEVTVLLLFARFAFGVPLRGDLVSLSILMVLGALAFAGLGVLVASRAKTIEGVSGLMNLVLMPMWLASGVFFSYERFPEAIQPALKALPLTALNDGLRASMLEGQSLGSFWTEALILTAWMVVSFTIALRVFRWR